MSKTSESRTKISLHTAVSSCSRSVFHYYCYIVSITSPKKRNTNVYDVTLRKTWRSIGQLILLLLKCAAIELNSIFLSYAIHLRRIVTINCVINVATARRRFDEIIIDKFRTINTHRKSCVSNLNVTPPRVSRILIRQKRSVINSEISNYHCSMTLDVCNVFAFSLKLGKLKSLQRYISFYLQRVYRIFVKVALLKKCTLSLRRDNFNVLIVVVVVLEQHTKIKGIQIKSRRFLFRRRSICDCC